MRFIAAVAVVPLAACALVSPESSAVAEALRERAAREAAAPAVSHWTFNAEDVKTYRQAFESGWRGMLETYANNLDWRPEATEGLFIGGSKPWLDGFYDGRRLAQAQVGRLRGRFDARTSVSIIREIMSRGGKETPDKPAARSLEH